jgi:hypothetical protein
MVRSSLRGLAIAGVLTAAACGGGGGGGGTRSTLLSPTKWGSFENGKIVDGTTGGTGGDGMLELNAGGLQAIVVGWEHFFDPSSNRMHNHVYSGAVHFNVAAFIPSSGRTIKKATLTYHVDDGVHTPSVGFFETDPMLLRLPAGPVWDGAPTVFPAPPEIATIAYPFIPWIGSEVPVGLMGGVVSLDVTAIVKAWADGSKANDGLVLQSNDFGTTGDIADSDAWWQILRDFEINVEWTF